MGNPFEDLRQAVVVRPMNSPGPQGAEAPDLMIEYSIDGTGGWTSEQPSAEFMYFRVSTDGGYTWSEPIVYGTEQAAYLQALKAQQWAENPENDEVEPGKYSSLHWAAKAEVQALKAQQWAENPENVEVEAGKYSALHHAAKAAMSEMNAEAAALDAARSATEAFGAAAPAWDSGAVYNYPDVVAFTNGHTYRCIGINVTSAPNVDGIDNKTDWQRITVVSDFEAICLDTVNDILALDINKITEGTPVYVMHDESPRLYQLSKTPSPEGSGRDIEMSDGWYAKYIPDSATDQLLEIKYRYNLPYSTNNLYIPSTYTGSLEDYVELPRGLNIYKNGDGSYRYVVDKRTFLGGFSYSIYISASGTGTNGYSIADAITFSQFQSNIDSGVYDSITNTHVRIVLLDDIYYGGMSNLVSLQTRINKQLHILSASPSGQTILTTPTTETSRENVGMNGTNGYALRGVADPVLAYSKYDRDENGMPIVLRKVSSVSEIQKGTWYSDGIDTFVFPYAFGSINLDGPEVVTNNASFSILPSGNDKNILIENIIFASGGSDACVHTCNTKNTTIYKNCKFLGGKNDGLGVTGSKYRVILLDCVSAYAGKDCFNYHSSATADKDSIVIEVNCKAYYAGLYKYEGGNITTNSNNASTAHDGLTVYRFGCSYHSCEGPIVADINGCRSINYGITSGNVLGTTTGIKTPFWTSSTASPAWAPSITVLVDCDGYGDNIEQHIKIENAEQVYIGSHRHRTGNIYNITGTTMEALK